MASKAHNPQNTKFKNATGQYLIKALFYEFSPNPAQVLYTLKDEDYEVSGIVYPSLRRLYLQEEDITEYAFAKKFFFGWEHWKKVSEASYIKPFVLRWREELNLQILEKSVAKIREKIEKGDKDALQALKYLLERGWDKKPSKAGRPQKEKEEIDMSALWQEDLSRILEKETPSPQLEKLN